MHGGGGCIAALSSLPKRPGKQISCSVGGVWEADVHVVRWGVWVANANAKPVQGGQERQDQQAEDERARCDAAA